MLMKTQNAIALVAAALMAAAAAGTPTLAATPSASATSVIALTKAQQKTAWKDLNGHAITMTPGVKFAAKLGTKIPSSVPIMQMSSKAAHAVPKLKSYDYTMAKGKLLIVNPKSRKVVAVIGA